MSATTTATLKTSSAASDYAPPTERPQSDFTPEQCVAAIPFEKFNYNPQFANKDPYVLISSGSFSPITILHTQLLTMVRDYIMIEKGIGHVLGALLSPVHDGYGKPSLISQQHRLKMCQLATEDIPWMGVSTIETDQTQWLETRIVFDLLQQGVDTIFKDVTIEHHTPTGEPQTLSLKPRLVFCMGSDVFLGFQHSSWWSHTDVEAYCTNYRIAVVLREEDRQAVQVLLKQHPVLSQYPDSVFIIPPTYKNTISSTLIRKQIATGGSIHGLVHPKVERYIYENALYRPKTPPQGPSAEQHNYVKLFLSQPTSDTFTPLTVKIVSPLDLPK